MHSARGGVLLGLHFNLIYNFLDVGNSLRGFVRFVPLRSGSYATLQNERPILGAVRDALVVQILVCLQRCFVLRCRLSRSSFFRQNLVNCQYQPLGFGKLVRIDRLGNQCYGI